MAFEDLNGVSTDADLEAAAPAAVASVPEPASIAIILVGLAAMCVMRRHKEPVPVALSRRGARRRWQVSWPPESDR